LSSMTKNLKTALDALKNGEMVILIDSEDRENEGDLVLAAEFSTPEKINFLIRQACGLVCLSLESEQVDRLGLPPMVLDNSSPRQTAFTVSIEAAQGVSTGISASDRSHTILVASDPKSTAKDVVAPGHIFPLRAAKGGVLERAGHTEGSIELCKLAGLRPAAVICEIINEDGSMARKPDLEKFAAKHNIPIVTIDELTAYQAIHTNWLTASSSAEFPNRHQVPNGHKWKIKSFKNKFNHAEHAVLFTENLESDAAPVSGVPLVRIHSECLTGDGLGSLRCDCGFQLELAMKEITESKTGGAVVYLKNQEGRGIGLWNKIQAYALQDQGSDTFDANVELGFEPDLRHYFDASKILLSMGLQKIRLLTNNLKKVEELKQFGIEVVERMPIHNNATPNNQAYLKTKREKFNHQLENI
jgi:3,4-dihydroxy 2-butanone 4-phosphate synthase/GTP cyclohydrolase II